jgi:hypothetical protein
VQAARNVLIIALIALAVTVLPGGGSATRAVLTAITMAFLAAIGFTAYRIHRENQFAIANLSDGWRAILYGALGLIALLIAGFDELFSTGAGTLAWVALFVLAVMALIQVIREASSGYL